MIAAVGVPRFFLAAAQSGSVTRLHGRLLVELPYETGRTALRAILDSLPPFDMRFWLPEIPIVARCVTVRFAPYFEELANDAWAVTWSAKGGGPFPIYEGTLNYRATEEMKGALETRGTYEPPLGTVGQCFDYVLGHRIANASARQFLGEISALMNDQLRASEIFERRRAPG